MTTTTKRIRIELDNPYHNRRTCVYARLDQLGLLQINVTQFQAAKRRLCGLPSCRCGGIWRAESEDGSILHVVDGPRVVNVIAL